MIRRRVLAVVVALCAGWPGEAPAAGVSRVEGTDLGPSMESVTAVFEDRSGFLWIGSREGLALYDGYTAVLFEHDVSDPASISDNNIRTIFEDSRGTLWIGTNTGGLERFDRDTWIFTHHRHDSQDPASLPHDSVYSIVEDRNGRYWVGTQGGLARFDAETGVFERVPAGPDGPASDYIVTLFLEQDGALWIATANGGLSRRDPQSGRFRTFRHDPTDPGSVPGDGVYALAADRGGQLWIATDSGVCTLARGDHRFRTIPFADFAGREAPVVTGIAIDPEGHVWASTLDTGLWRLDKSSEPPAFRVHPFMTSRSTDSRARIVFTMTDRAGNVWIGTWSEGLGRVSPRSRLLSAGPISNLSGEISSLLLDEMGRMWVGLLTSEIFVHSPGAATRRLELGQIPLRMVEAGGFVWVGSSGGLVRIDPETGRMKRYAHDEHDPGSLGPGWAWAVHQDREGRLWVGTGEGGLHRLLGDGSFRRYLHEPSDPHSLSDDYVTVILEAPDGGLFVGTRSGGLNSFHPDTARFTRYLPDPTDERSLSHHSVSSLLVDRSGQLWVGTAGGGLNRGRRDASGLVSEFERITERDGLISNNVVSLLEDDDGTIWVGTRRGLSRYDAASGRFLNYGTADGLASSELTVGAAAKGESLLYFGTHRGIAAVQSGSPFPELEPSPTVVTAIRSIGDPRSTERAAPTNLEVTVPWGRILSFEFSVLDYGDRRRHRYQYRVSGRRDQWIDLGSRHEITFTDLEPGKYELTARGRNDQGVWSELDRPIRITVIPPFWMTAWFRLLVATIVVGAALGGHRIRMARLEQRNRQLENLKNQRELALDEARRSQEALHGAYERLRRLTRRLEAAKEDERKHIARELHDEMGQALTTAKLNLQLIAASSLGEEGERRVTDTLSLLDRMIGHVRALSFDLRPPLLDELGLAAALRGYAESLSRRTGVRVDLRVDPIPQGIPTEIEIAAFRVVQESLTNVLRHSGANRAGVEVRYDPAGLELEVEDDGRGFDVAGALERAASGEHVGLLGMRERVESMGGTLSIRSEHGGGARLRAHFPLG